MNQQQLIYLASPYSHSDPKIMEKRFQLVLKATAELTNQGLLIYSPIVHSHPMAVDYKLPTDFNFWQKYNFGMIDHCNAIAVLTIDGWRESKGIKGEMQYAMSTGKDIFYVNPTEPSLSRTLVEIEFEEQPKPKKIFIIGPVRDADEELKNKLEVYAGEVYIAGNIPYLPHLSTNQEDPNGGINICMQNRAAILESDEIHVWYDPNSVGSIFDLGMAFSHDKIIKLINPEDVQPTNEKSFANVLLSLHKRFTPIEETINAQ